MINDIKSKFALRCRTGITAGVGTPQNPPADPHSSGPSCSSGGGGKTASDEGGQIGLGKDISFQKHV